MTHRINYITNAVVLQVLRQENATHYVAVTGQEYIAYRPSAQYPTRLEEKSFSPKRLDTPWTLSLFNNPPFGAIPVISTSKG